MTVTPTWSEGVDPSDWRNLPDEDGDDDALDRDESLPTPQYVIDVLGFDPDEEDWDTTENEQTQLSTPWWELLEKPMDLPPAG